MMKQMPESSTPRKHPMSDGPSSRPVRRSAPQIQRWTIEELRALAHQLQIRGAATKNREELLELFTAPRDRANLDV